MSINELYQRILTRVNAVVPGACTHISVREPVSSESELRFFQLVIWGYVLYYEAARVPAVFLTELAPTLDGRELRKDISRLRTFLAHNLSPANYSDRKTIEYVKRWFRDCCGKDFPGTSADFDLCVERLESTLIRVLEGLLASTAMLEDPADGPGLTEDLAARVALEWPASEFDSVAERVAGQLGMGFFDTRGLRQRRLDSWRDTVRRAAPGAEVDALERVIEGELVEVMRGMLSVSAAEVLATFGFRTPDAVMAALLMIQQAEVAGGLNCSQLLEAVGDRVD